jgi:uncharacterized sulfatase
MRGIHRGNNMRNILLVILDTLRRDRLSAYGHTRETSPAFDAFVADATFFEHAVATSQWTIPSHSSMFTGLYPSSHHVTQSNGRLSPSQPVLAEILHNAGYHTVAFCNNPLVGVLDNGLQRGFEHFFNYASAIPSRPNDHRKPWLRREFSRRFRPYARRMGNKFAHSDNMFRLALNPLFVPIWTRYINFKGHTANSVGDLIDYWNTYEARGAERPIFAFLNLMGAHLPYQPPQNMLDRVAPGVRNDRHAYQFIRLFNADAGAWASPPEPPLTDWQQQALLDFYDAEIASQDEQLGRLLDYLQKSGTLANTTVIITADHGEGHGEHNLFGHGFNVHQELIHVPLIIYDPERFTRGARITANLSTRRLFHTILDIAGVKPPLPEGDPNANISALSLTNAVNDEEDIESGMAFSEAYPVQTFVHVLEHRNPSVIERMHLREVRRSIYDGDYKLIICGEKVEALYNVAADPAETHNLIANEPARLAEMQRKLTAFMQQFESASTLESVTAEDDAQVLEHLRALGYIE